MMKILIADDEYMEREALADVLRKRFGEQAEVRIAVNGQQAVDIGAFWGVDVALLDIEMPGLSGIQAAWQLREQNPDCKLIFITAYSLFSYAQEAVKLGACDYILKPPEDREVERAIQRAIGQTETQRMLVETGRETGLTDKSAKLIANVRRYMSHNYMRFDMSLDLVSDLLGMNGSYFSTIFKRAVGVNFIDYLTELRVNAAKELLRDPLRSSGEIAGLVGYESPSYFTRAFKKKTGMTPTEYRKSLAGETRIEL